MIHPTAIISKKAKIASNVKVGPYTIIEDNVEIGSGTKVGSFCNLAGFTIIGKNNQIFSNTVIGSIPQDLKYKGEKSWVVIGDGNRIREFVTINLGTSEGGKTVIGNNNLIMAYAHIAHDCVINNDTIVANVGTLAGHVLVDDGAIIGGLSGVHQFVRIGKLAIIGGCSKVVQDVPPYSICDGYPAKVRGLNTVGLKRAGFSNEKKSLLKKAFRILFLAKHPTFQGVETLKKEPRIYKEKEIKYLIEFIQSSRRGICI